MRGELASVKHWVALGADVPGWERFESLLEGQPASAPAHRAAPDDDVYQMYTSGTTGRPKGAVLTHRAVVSHLYQASFAFGGAPGERMLVVAPLYHAAGSMATFVDGAGGRIALRPGGLRPGRGGARALRGADRDGGAGARDDPVLPGRRPRRRGAPLRRRCGSSSTAPRRSRSRRCTRAIEVFGCDFLQAYGMTETTAAVTYLMPADHRRALAGEPKLLLSAGRPLLGTEIRIVGERRPRRCRTARSGRSRRAARS